MGAAIVAGANGANVYSYAGRKTSFDTFLEAPGNGTGIPPEIRSATFCWNEEDREFECTEESAWADGEAFNSVYRSYWHSFQIGNWAGTYHINDVPQAATLVVNEEPIGQAMFSHDLNGEVMITVALYEPWRFANRMDSRGNIADNVHIQGYIEAPTRYPSPKYFDHTMLAEESPFSTKVDMRPYYAVHVDVTRCTSTENTPSGDDTPPAEDDTPED
jgi:hypothetical protein